MKSMQLKSGITDIFKVKVRKESADCAGCGDLGASTLIPTKTTGVKRPPDHSPDPTADLGLMERFSPLSHSRSCYQSKACSAVSSGQTR